MNIKNKKFRLLAILFFIICLFNPTIIGALKYPDINSKIVEIYDLTDDKVIYEIDSNKQTSIASLTKIVTTITAIESISNLDEEVVITNKILDTVNWESSKAGLKAGDKLTYRDLLYASMLPSGADATNALAILSSGSIDNFVQRMNGLVSRLGLSHTHFVNVTGLDVDGHYSTADETRKILLYALKNDLFRTIYTTREYTLSNGLIVKSTIYKYNTFPKMDTSNILGSKSGYTDDAGYCLSSISNINDHEFIIIVLNAEHKGNRYYNVVDTVNLIDFLLDNYSERLLVKKDELIETIPVKLSKTDNYEIRASKDIKLYLPSDYDKTKIKAEYKGIKKLSFFNKVGKKIGSIDYYYDDELIAQEDVKLEYKLKMDIHKIIKTYWLLIIIIIVFIGFIYNRKKKTKKRRRKKIRLRIKRRKK